MELKDKYLSVLFDSASANPNPFNGIEREHRGLNALTGASRCMNPFNGIERNFYLTVHVHYTKMCEESIQWN